MCRCHDSVGGCLSVSASCINDGIKVTCGVVSADMELIAQVINEGLVTVVTPFALQLMASASMATTPLRVTASIVCDVEIDTDGFFFTKDDMAFYTAEGYMFEAK